MEEPQEEHKQDDDENFDMDLVDQLLQKHSSRSGFQQETSNSKPDRIPLNYMDEPELEPATEPENEEQMMEESQNLPCQQPQTQQPESMEIQEHESLQPPERMDIQEQESFQPPERMEIQAPLINEAKEDSPGTPHESILQTYRYSKQRESDYFKPNKPNNNQYKMAPNGISPSPQKFIGTQDISSQFSQLFSGKKDSPPKFDSKITTPQQTKVVKSGTPPT